MTSTPPLDGPSIYDVPDALLGQITSYLPEISRALLAVSFSAPSSSPGWSGSECSDSDRELLSCHSRVIVSLNGEQWETLDFADIERSLAERLDDDDLCALLVCIGAARKLKRLKLTRCTGLTGTGLQPLCGSTVLEQIDLSLVGQYEHPKAMAEGLGGSILISVEACVPILDSIIGAEGNSLRHLQLPKTWRIYNNNSMLEGFVSRYNKHLNGRPFDCAAHSENDNNCLGTNGGSWLSRSEDGYPPQEFTCCKCLKNCCRTSGRRKTCENCAKNYCDDCNAAWFICCSCGDTVCMGCLKTERNGACDVR
ncbi:hypothetical protein ACHAWF_000769 [Thalassiosira exigua]